MAEERRLPRGPVLVCIAIIVPFAVLAWYAATTRSMGWWAFLMVGVVPLTGYLYWAFRRCPICRSRMTRQEHRDSYGRNFIWLYCPKCNIRWNTGQFISDFD